MKILSIFLALILIMGIIPSANFLVTAQRDVSIFTPNGQAAIDLNDEETTTLEELLKECPSGLFVYNGINGEIVIACLIDGAYAKLFNNLGQEIKLDIDIDTSYSNNDDDDDDDDDNNDKPDRDCGDNGNFTKSFWEKWCKKFAEGGSNMTMGTDNDNDNDNGNNDNETDPRFDDKYDMIDWQDDRGEEYDMTQEEMDEHLEEQEENNSNDDESSNDDDIEATLDDSGIDKE